MTTMIALGCFTEAPVRFETQSRLSKLEPALCRGPESTIAARTAHAGEGQSMHEGAEKCYRLSHAKSEW
jgi:hypothetical protein